MISTTIEQLSVINSREGAYSVSSGPGTGKTFVVTNRYASLIKSGINPSEILCITFTKKAAEEMKQRICKLVPEVSPSSLQVFTFHGFCNSWLRKKGDLIGYPKYTIMSTDETEKIINDVVRVHSINDPKRDKDPSYADSLTAENKKAKEKVSVIFKVLNRLESNPDISLPEAVKLAIKTSDHNIVEFCKKCITHYAKHKTTRNKLDFSNLQPLMIKLLDVEPSIAHQYKYIMTDESQDCNGINLKLLQKLAVHSNIMAVNDHKQSIYGFRGSNSDAVKEFIKMFNAKELFLTHNFRSSKNIVEFANASIMRKEEKMEAYKKNNGVLYFKEFNDSKEEVRAIVSKIKILRNIK